MKLIVGLGNPGKQYEHTRHNMGYDAIDEFAEMVGADFDRNKFNGDFSIVKDDRFPDDFILAKPLTFMNLSGEFVRPLMDYFKIPVEDVLVIYDDMALKPGNIRLRPGGSHAGHNGIKNIIQMTGTEQIKRIRVGIGEPLHTGVDWVLWKASGEEADALKEGCHKAALALRDYLLHGFEYAMNHYN